MDKVNELYDILKELLPEVLDNKLYNTALKIVSKGYVKVDKNEIVINKEQYQNIAKVIINSIKRDLDNMLNEV